MTWSSVLTPLLRTPYRCGAMRVGKSRTFGGRAVETREETAAELTAGLWRVEPAPRRPRGTGCAHCVLDESGQEGRWPRRRGPARARANGSIRAGISDMFAGARRAPSAKATTSA